MDMNMWHSLCLPESPACWADGHFDDCPVLCHRHIQDVSEHRKGRGQFWLILDWEKPEVLQNGSFRDRWEALMITALSSRGYSSQDAVLFIVGYRSLCPPISKTSIIFFCSLSFSTSLLLLFNHLHSTERIRVQRIGYLKTTMATVLCGATWAKQEERRMKTGLGLGQFGANVCLAVLPLATGSGLSRLELIQN